MANYTGPQSIGEEALGEFAEFGFTAKTIDHTLELYFKDKRIAVYNLTTLTIPILQEGCRNFLKNIAGYQKEF